MAATVLYLVCIEISCEPTTILGVSQTLEQARKIAGNYRPIIDDIVIFEMEDGKDYDWDRAPTVPVSAE